MKSSQISRHLPASLALVLIMTTAIASYAQPGGNDNSRDMTSSTTNTVTITEPPSANNYLTPEEMRAAKPMPMPSSNQPPVPQQTSPTPYMGPAGGAPGAPPGLGGPAPR